MLFSKKNKSLIQEDEPTISAWLENEQTAEEGQLAIDVFHDDEKIVIKSTIAGALSENIKISLHNDMLTIKGRREPIENIPLENYLFLECYWGPFSRSIILPAEVDSKKVEAEIENGVLTVTLKKALPEQIEIKTKD